MQGPEAFRARRPPSPHRQGLTNPLPSAVPRFPQHRVAENLTADEKLDAARHDGDGRPVLTRKLHAGGLRKMNGGEWKLLIIVALVATFVRLFRLSKPNSVVCVCSRGSAALNANSAIAVSTRFTSASLLANISRCVRCSQGLTAVPGPLRL